MAKSKRLRRTVEGRQRKIDLELPGDVLERLYEIGRLANTTLDQTVGVILAAEVLKVKDVQAKVHDRGPSRDTR